MSLTVINDKPDCMQSPEIRSIMPALSTTEAACNRDQNSGSFRTPSAPMSTKKQPKPILVYSIPNQFVKRITNELQVKKEHFDANNVQIEIIDQYFK